MKYVSLFILSLALALTTVAEDKLPDEKAMQGTWQVVKAEMGGQAMGNDFVKVTTLKMENGKYEVMVADAPDRGTYTLSPEMKPKKLDIAGTEGPNAGKKIPAIYELKGDRLVICYGLRGSARPTEFKSPAGTTTFLVTYERKK